MQNVITYIYNESFYTLHKSLRKPIIAFSYQIQIKNYTKLHAMLNVKTSRCQQRKILFI